MCSKCDKVWLEDWKQFREMRMKDTNKFAPVAVAALREGVRTVGGMGVGEAWLVLTASLGGRIIYAVPFPLPISIHFPSLGLFVCFLLLATLARA